MFKFLKTKDQILIEKRKNEMLQARLFELEEATIELAEVVAMNEEEIDNG